MSIRVVPFDPAWSGGFAEEAARIRAVLGDCAAEIHHIGSTAIAGIPAKPIIDILLETPDLSELDDRAWKRTDAVTASVCATQP